jgi:heavy metal sensor kinase
MKSIRVSLIVYFLLLLAAALGTASVLVYRTAADILREKQEVNRQLLGKQYQELKDKESEKYDDDLLAQAKIIYFQVQSQNPWNLLRATPLMRLGLMSETNAHYTSLLWAAETTGRGPPGWIGQWVQGNIIAENRRLFTEILLNEDELPRDPDGGIEYFQINSSSELSKPWRSKSLGDFTLPFDAAPFAGAELASVKHDDVILDSGRKVRRVQMKANFNRFRPPFGRAPRNRSVSDAGRLPPPPRDSNPPPDFSAPWMVIHCASVPIRRDSAVAALGDELDRKYAEQEADAQEALRALRQRLLWIAVFTFAATTLGGSLLVGLGLAPLHRLTEAVSRVTPKDFRLPIAADEYLPNELTPIRERLQHTLNELRKAFEREKQAAADISHELRTPVASILTAVEVALKKPRSPEEYRETLRECREVARQMRHLVERLLALARIDAGSDRLRPRPVDVGELVTECAALVRPLAGERGLDLRVNCPKPVTWTTDPDKLREVLVNLLHNAVQYNRPDGAIDVSAEAADGWLDLQVHDTGIGIEPKAFDHIFERFYRADSSRHSDDLHAGLGLSIVKAYVGLLGGTISVESQIGRGSTFRVRLPAAATAA